MSHRRRIASKTGCLIYLFKVKLDGFIDGTSHGSRMPTYIIHPGWFLVFVCFFLDLVETYDLRVDLFPGLGQSLVNVNNNNVALNLLDVSK